MNILDLDTDHLPQSTDALVAEALHAVRTLLGMEIAFVAEFRHGYRVFRYVDADAAFRPVEVGGSNPLEDSYCQRVVEGKLPTLVRDAQHEAGVADLPATEELPVGAHITIPIRFSSGRVYGTFCCVSRHPDETLTQRDVGVVRLFADFVGKVLERQAATESARNRVLARLHQVLERRHFTVVYQAIVDVASGEAVGHEALARFHVPPERTPDVWFNEAAGVGLQTELEIAMIGEALEGLTHFPEATYLSLNVSPETILSGSLDVLLAEKPLQRLMLEVTEHALVSDYAGITNALAPLRDQGLRLAVDDAGAGFASFRHILQLKPDVIKLDRSLIHGIDHDLDCRALAAALVRFAEETGSSVVAEGVETEAELQTLRTLKVGLAQGHLLGVPQPA